MGTARNRLKIFTEASAKIDEMRTQLTNFLNTTLPARILSKANIFNMTIDVVTDISSLQTMYSENAVNENNILVANYEQSVRGLSQMTGHKAVRAISSRGSLNIIFMPLLKDEAKVLRFTRDTKIKCLENNLLYFYNGSNDTFTIPTNVSSIQLEFIEGVRISETYTSLGDAMETVRLDNNNPIENYYINVFVNGEKWEKFDSIYEDMGVDTKGYIIKNGFANQVDIVFGTGVQGMIPSEGSSITVEYITTNGSLGNLDTSNTFKIEDGLADQDGNDISVNDLVDIQVGTGFQLGSDGEDIELTRLNAGYSSRSLTFPQPENIKAYLSRLSVLSNIDVWVDSQTKVFSIMPLPNIASKLAQNTDYLNLSESDFALASVVKDDIIGMINNSRRQYVGTELQIVDPVLRKYAVLVYVDAVIYDIDSFKNCVFDAVLEQIIEQTFSKTIVNDRDSENYKRIPKVYLTNAIFDLPEVDNVALTVISERNERARIDGTYTQTSLETVGGIKKRVSKVITVGSEDNPNLGFTELNDIYVGSGEIPILMGGFDIYGGVGVSETIDDAITIFSKDETGRWVNI